MHDRTEDAARMKYNRDLAKLADLFHVSRTKWTIRRSGQCVFAVSDLGNTIWAKNFKELEDVLEKAGVDQNDIKISWR